MQISHPASWNWTPDVRLVSKVLVSDVIFRADKHSTRSFISSRNWKKCQLLIPVVFFNTNNKHGQETHTQIQCSKDLECIGLLANTHTVHIKTIVPMYSSQSPWQFYQITVGFNLKNNKHRYETYTQIYTVQQSFRMQCIDKSFAVNPLETIWRPNNKITSLYWKKSQKTTICNIPEVEACLFLPNALVILFLSSNALLVLITRSL